MARDQKTRCILWSSVLIVLSLNVVSSNPLLFQQQQTPVRGSVQCDSRTSCGPNQTCCRLSSGQWGCCPYPKAVCCSDGEHCCPNGFTCNIAEGRCTRDNQQHVVDMLPKLKAYSPFETSDLSLSTAIVKCNATQYCDDKQTCCKLTTEDWGCCPHPKAVCCSDDFCCPHDFTCDVPNLHCYKRRDDGEATTITSLTSSSAGTQQQDGSQEQGQIESVSLAASSQLTVAVGERIVPCDQQWYCRDGETCCMMASLQWGCCPRPQAVCCPDRETCCPNGYICVPGRKCIHAESRFLPDANYWNVVPSMTRIPAMYRPVSPAEDKKEKEEKTEVMGTAAVEGTVMCPDRNACSPNSSCCQLSTGVYACCPYHDGVCCETHCCPAGTTCDPENNGCVSHSSWASLAP